MTVDLRSERQRRRLAAVFGMLGLAGLGVGLAASPAGAQTPGGDNGTVKVDGVELDNAPDQEPHPGCSLDVDFYGFDVQQTSGFVTITLKVPGEADVVVVDNDEVTLDGDDRTGGATEEGFDGSATYDLNEELSAFEPQAQGWHLRIDVTVPFPGNEEAAFDKFKVIWAEGCEAPPPPPAPAVPSASASQCVAVDGGFAVRVTMTNAAEAEEDAVFSIVVGGVAQPDVTVAPGGSETRDFAQTEDVAITVSVSSGDFSLEQTFDSNCTTPQVAPTTTAAGVAPAELARTGSVTPGFVVLAGIAFLLGGVALGGSTLAPARRKR
jgi:hypothetical protein